MRKIVNQKTEVIILEQIDNSQLVGIQWDSVNRAFVLRDEEGKFRAVGDRQYDFDLANTWYRDSLQEYVEAALKQSGTQAFVFNTTKELFKWMSE